jgi:hypothetical protein
VQLGVDQSVPLEVVIERVEPGDGILLSTDGVWRLFRGHDIPALVDGTVGDACAGLTALTTAEATEDASAVVVWVA